LRTVAIDGDLEAAVLRTPAFGDVELAENLDARRHFAHLLVDLRAELAKRLRPQDAVDAESDVQPVRQHFQVNIAAMTVDRLSEQLAEELIRAYRDDRSGGGLEARLRRGVCECLTVRQASLGSWRLERNEQRLAVQLFERVANRWSASR